MTIHGLCACGREHIADGEERCVLCQVEENGKPVTVLVSRDTGRILAHDAGKYCRLHIVSAREFVERVLKDKGHVHTD